MSLAIANYQGSGAGANPANNGSQKPHFLQSDPQFKRPDHQIYISNLPQKAGVSTYQIRKLVLKELVDNALDEMDAVGRPGEVTITQDEFADNVYTVTDKGRGIPGTPKEIALVFSCDKPMTSGKQLRKPTRGCVGNGLRVIVGSVASGGGRIIVKTHDREIILRPRLNGTTEVEKYQKTDWPIGTSVTIEIDPKYPLRGDSLDWAELAITLAKNSEPPFARQPSVHWYDQRHLAFSILAGSPPKYTLRELVSRLDRCTGREIQQRVTDRFGKGRLCQDMNQQESATLLSILREGMATIKPKQLGPMGEGAWKHEELTDGYACEEGTLEIRGTPGAEIPFLVEVWAATCETPEDVPDDKVYPVDIVGFTINRSPAIASFSSERDGRSRNVSLTLGQTPCGLELRLGPFDFAINITSPYVPILSDNKSPDIDLFKKTICATVEKAIGRAARNNPPTLIVRSKVEREDDDEEDRDKPSEDKPERVIQRDAIWEVLPESIEHNCFKDGVPFFEFGQRNLFYTVRNLVLARGCKEPKWPYFTSVVTDYENEVGEIDLLTRDERGGFQEPHGGEFTAMGTKSVAAYERPPWSYSNVLFIEKQTFVTTLEQVNFGERFDCFIMTSKGFCTRAGKDLIDKIAKHNEDTRFFSVHDADNSGPLIHQSLVEETRTRGARNVEVIDLGFFPWTAISEGLLKEPVALKIRKSGKVYKRPVADCVKERDASNRANGNPDGEPNWENWLQHWRVELNAMTPPQFAAWITAQFEKHGASKTIPPGSLGQFKVTESLKLKVSSACAVKVKNERQPELDALQEKVNALNAEINKEAQKRAEERLKEIKIPSGEEIVGTISEWLKKNPYSHWRQSIDDVATELIPEDERPDPDEEDDIADDIIPEGQEEDEGE